MIQPSHERADATGLGHCGAELASAILSALAFFD
jgi:hypothetical protein